MKRNRLLLSLLLSALCLPPLRAQLSLEECRRQARDNYPLIRQYGLIEQAAQYDVANAAKAYLPQVSLSAKASYQSDVTKTAFRAAGHRRQLHAPRPVSGDAAGAAVRVGRW